MNQNDILLQPFHSDLCVVIVTWEVWQGSKVIQTSIFLVNKHLGAC